jgi:hypothetical protein
LNPLMIEIAAVVAGPSAPWAICWMIVSRRKSRSFDHAADIVKQASPAEQAKVAKAMAELARAFARDRPPLATDQFRRDKGPG